MDALPLQSLIPVCRQNAAISYIMSHRPDARFTPSYTPSAILMAKPELQASPGRAVSPDSHLAELWFSRRRSEAGISTRSQPAADRLSVPQTLPPIAAPSADQSLTDATLLPSPGTRHIEPGRTRGETRIRTHSASRTDDRQSRRDRHDAGRVFIRDHHNELSRYGDGPRAVLSRNRHSVDPAWEPPGWDARPTILQPDPVAYGGNYNSSGVRVAVAPFVEANRRQYQHAPGPSRGVRPKRYVDVDESSTSSTPGSDSDSDSGRVPYDFMTTQESQETKDSEQNDGLQKHASNNSHLPKEDSKSPLKKIKTDLVHRRVSHSVHKKEDSPGSAIAPAQLFVNETGTDVLERDSDHLFQW